MQVKRRFNRWQLNKEAKIKLQGAENFINGIINDISFMGAKITLPIKLPPDTFLKISIALSGENILNVEAWVTWQKTIDGHYVYGLCFTKISDPDKEKIYRFVYQCMPGEIQKRHWEGPLKEKGGEVMEDRRVFQRFSIRFPLRFLDMKNSREGNGESLDISAKGIGLITNMALQPKAPLEIWLSIPDRGEPLYTRGEVVWSKPESAAEYRVGVNLEKADLMSLSRILRAE